MSQSLGNYRPHSSHQASEQYAEAEVRMASPAKLRLMLIERAIEVARLLSAGYLNKSCKGTCEYSITLLDFLNELLEGVSGSEDKAESKLCNQVADLYIFLAKHLLLAEQHSDAAAIDEIRLVLESEAETWRAVVATENSHSGPAKVPADTSGGLNFSA